MKNKNLINDSDALEAISILYASPIANMDEFRDEVGRVLESSKSYHGKFNNENIRKQKLIHFSTGEGGEVLKLQNYKSDEELANVTACMLANIITFSLKKYEPEGALKVIEKYTEKYLGVIK
ncbi:hypothetical protein [Lactococcus lactis]|uniref:hypothetical protein n=1 Tax=Lactococcus lactis TaxID=1358 RepID=UPI0023A97836|nr:hypothetical protein [Lactococcus lactis]WEA55136.1 hypothetical protein PWP91_12790 [Lactococcus lactis]